MQLATCMIVIIMIDHDSMIDHDLMTDHDHLQVRLLYERVSKQKRPIMAHLDDPVIVYIPLIRLVMLKALGNT